MPQGRGHCDEAILVISEPVAVQGYVARDRTQAASSGAERAATACSASWTEGCRKPASCCMFGKLHNCTGPRRLAQLARASVLILQLDPWPATSVYTLSGLQNPAESSPTTAPQRGKYYSCHVQQQSAAAWAGASSSSAGAILTIRKSPKASPPDLSSSRL